jgi:8-oxo-dGTP pyrophosphatase MutT (NUDIX family)
MHGSETAEMNDTTAGVADADAAEGVVIQITSAEDALDDVHTRYIVNMPDEEFHTFQEGNSNSSNENANHCNNIFFQLEQAWWFYDDFYCDNDATLPRYSSLKPFGKKMFSWSPLLQPRQSEFATLWAIFMKYKNKISTYGTILMNQDCTHIVLCQTYGGKSWTVPSGKVNPGENGVLAGARETYEETGFDPDCHLGLTKKMKHDAGLTVSTLGPDGLPTKESSTEEVKQLADQQKQHLGWFPLREEDALTYVEQPSGKRRTCYVCRGVPMDFSFEPVCRKEVGDIQWHALSDIPKKSYAVIPFVKQLKRWIKRRVKNKSGGGNNKGGAGAAGNGNGSKTPNQTPKKERRQKNSNSNEAAAAPGGTGSTSKKDRANSEGEGGESSIGSGGVKGDPASSTKKKKKKKEKKLLVQAEVTTVTGTGGGGTSTSDSRSASRSGSRGRNRDRSNSVAKETDDIVKAGLASPGEKDGWSEEDMFRVNEQIMGRPIDYDGNPHKFVSETEDGMACHRFHVVGGTFMNSPAMGDAGTRSGGGPASIGKIAPPPSQSRLQPLFRSQNADQEVDVDDPMPFQPFFTDAGMSPWGEMGMGMVPDVPAASDTNVNVDTNVAPFTSTTTTATTTVATPKKKASSPNKSKIINNHTDQGLLELLKRHSSSALGSSTRTVNVESGADAGASAKVLMSNSFNDLFLTDQEITSRSQATKLGSTFAGEVKAAPTPTVFQDLEFMKKWLEQMRPLPPPTTPAPGGKLFNPKVFKFHMEPILKALHSYDDRI